MNDVKSPFKYPDTNSARARIDHLNDKFTALRVGIIGLGGTGSYILDLVAKTKVSEIHLYDADSFDLHNAFRAPGAVDGTFLDNNAGIKKVVYLGNWYSNMHTGIISHACYVDSDTIEQLYHLDFVFIAIDKNKARTFISEQLIKAKIPHIDCGLGIHEIGGALSASARITLVTPQKHDHATTRMGGEDLDDDLYNSNIQIADLNCLAATLAVLKWKRQVGFYASLKNEHNIVHRVSTNKIFNDDFPV